MIARIRGILIEASLTEALVDVGGVGYLVFIPVSTFDKLPKPGQETTLLTHMHVREDAMQLYGFATIQERTLFELLTSVNGIGVKTALNVLSCMPVSSFCTAVTNGDVKSIKKINGIGEKSAERIILELKDKIAKIFPETVYQTPQAAQSAKNPAVEDAVLALEQLGFKREKVLKIVLDIAAGLDKKECSTENLLRKSLQSLNK